MRHERIPRPPRQPSPREAEILDMIADETIAWLVGDKHVYAAQLRIDKLSRKLRRPRVKSL